ncbi:MAG: acetyl-CoA C-acetyltransferase [Clostridia bacterium]|nr:acetyl-CoA C-acetyltransferase [Clostridia bacterium]
MKEVVIISGARTPVGDFGGQFKDFLANELASIAIEEAIARAGVAKEEIEEVILGNCIQRSDEPNVARVASLKAGIPHGASAFTIQRQCASGMQAVVSAAQEIALGDSEIVVAGGVESMSSSPYVLKSARWGQRLQHGEMSDAMWDILTDPIHKIMMGETAERLVDKYGITREEQDIIALRSHQNAIAAIDSGRFTGEIVPVKVPQRRGEPKVVAVDEHARRDITLESLDKLRPAFRKDGTVTAGNASGLNDGATALVLTSRQKAEQLGKQPLGRIVAYSWAGVEPDLMGYGPVPAVRKVLKKAGLTLGDIDLIEVNEAFAAQYLACEKLLGLNREIVNVNGSGVALGHPVGSTGARLIVTLLYELARRNGRRGLATLCIGGGMGMAVIVERD